MRAADLTAGRDLEGSAAIYTLVTPTLRAWMLLPLVAPLVQRCRQHHSRMLWVG